MQNRGKFQPSIRYQQLLDRLVAAEPECGYSDTRSLPDLSVAEVAAVIRQEPRVLALVPLDSEAVVQSLELQDLERSAIRLALHLRNGIELAVRNYLFCEVIERCGRAAA